jgi:geranylgeranyl reductase family protein
MRKHDVVVVGAGPAGSAAAHYLAASGVAVLLLDKNAFPRDKACGDLISRRTLRLLTRMGLKSWLDEGNFHIPHGVRLGAPSGELAVVRVPPQADWPNGFVWSIPRKKLDAALVDAAVAAGAQFWPGVRATGMSVDEGKASVHTSASGRRETLHCQTVIAADGSSGSFSRSVGLHKGTLPGVAVRTYYAGDDPYEEFLDMFWVAEVLPGYVWILPEGQGVCNVGIGGFVGGNGEKGLMRQLQNLISSHSCIRDRLHSLEMVDRPRGGGLALDFCPRRVYQDRLLAVGDAAGLVSPLTGSGISRALISGETAAECVYFALDSGDCSRDGLASYGQKLQGRFGRQHLLLRVLQRLFTYKRVPNRLVRLLNCDESARQIAHSLLSRRSDYTVLLKPHILVRLLV